MTEEHPKTAMFWQLAKSGKISGIRCSLCSRECFISDGSRGFCKIRENRKNKLFSLNYGKIVALNIDPIEKKPLFHFHPSSRTLSYACSGCNFACDYCCNWEISRFNGLENLGKNFKPKQIVDMALKENVNIISHTYTEPTIFFEFAFDIAKLASKKKIKNTFVTNGYIMKKPLMKISKFLDAATVDFKASGDEIFMRKYASVPSMEPVFETLKLMRKLKMHTEITNLIVPKIGEDKEKFKELAEWVLNNLGPNVPFHLLRFFPTYKMLNFDATPLQTLENFARLAKKIGLNYVYIGNVPGHHLENTYCPKCGEMIIERTGFAVKSKILDGKCPRCNMELEGFVLDS